MQDVLDALNIKVGDRIFVALIGQGGVVAKIGPGGQPVAGPGQMYLPRRHGIFRGLTTFATGSGSEITWLRMRVEDDPGGAAEAAIRVEAILEVGFESSFKMAE